MTASFLASIKNTESILLTISFSDSFVFIYFYKVSRSKKKSVAFVVWHVMLEGTGNASLFHTQTDRFKTV